jgi:hypothetical protein
MSSDNFDRAVDSVIAPARNCFSITPSDLGELPLLPKAIFVGNGGDIVVRAVDSSSDVRFANVSSGTILDIRLKSIRATGTTASSIVGLA